MALDPLQQGFVADSTPLKRADCRRPRTTLRPPLYAGSSLPSGRKKDVGTFTSTCVPSGDVDLSHPCRCAVLRAVSTFQPWRAASSRQDNSAKSAGGSSQRMHGTTAVRSLGRSGRFVSPDRGKQKRPGRNSTDLSFVFLSLPVHPWSKPVDGVSRAALSEAHQQSR